MGSEQVAAVLRQSGSQVRLVVARPIESSAIDIIQVFNYLVYFNFLKFIRSHVGTYYTVNLLLKSYRSTHQN